MKTRKALLKRIKITKNKKILKRALNQSHFNAKDSGNKTRAKRKKDKASSAERKIIKKMLFL